MGWIYPNIKYVYNVIAFKVLFCIDKALLGIKFKSYNTNVFDIQCLSACFPMGTRLSVFVTTQRLGRANKQDTVPGYYIPIFQAISQGSIWKWQMCCHTWITEGLLVKSTCWTPTSCKTELMGLWSNLFLSRCIKWMLSPGPKMRVPPCWTGSPWKSKGGPVTARHRLQMLPESIFDFIWGLCPEEAISSPLFIPKLL